MLEQFYDGFVSPILDKNIWTNAYGLARSLFAMGTLLTLGANSISTLFVRGGLPGASTCAGPRQISLFCLLGGHLLLAKWIAIACLAIIASGWRPRYTGIVHAWVSFSIIASVGVIDGGDQITAVLTLLLIPITLLDSRRWHWDRPPAEGKTKPDLQTHYKYITGWVFYLAIRVQVAIIYFQAAIGKLNVEQWKNGTALYYYFMAPWYGAPGFLQPVLKVLTLNATFGVLLTWGVMLVETLLFTALVMPRRWRRFFLKVGLGFHFAIIFIHGLPSFFFAMAGALVLYLHPMAKPLRWLPGRNEPPKSFPRKTADALRKNDV